MLKLNYSQENKKLNFNFKRSINRSALKEKQNKTNKKK